MKLSRRSKWLVFIIFCPVCLLWVVHERNRRLLTGTWETVEVGYNPPDMHLYQTFNGDGTGETVVESQGQKGSAPFTYKFAALSRLQITSDTSFCGIAAVHLDDPCLQSGQPYTEDIVSLISFSVDGDKMYFIGFDNTYAQRVALNPLPAERP